LVGGLSTGDISTAQRSFPGQKGFKNGVKGRPKRHLAPRRPRAREPLFLGSCQSNAIRLFR
jgi:hypothetical protein